MKNSQDRGRCCYGAQYGQPKNGHNEVASEMSINNRHKQHKDGLR